MLMRYHWGLGIGHTYSHGRNIPSQQYKIPPPEFEAEEPAVENLPAAITSALNEETINDEQQEHDIGNAQINDDAEFDLWDSDEEGDVELEGDDSDEDYAELAESYID